MTLYHSWFVRMPLAGYCSVQPVLFPGSTDYAGRVPFTRTHRGTYR
jgi:hypothetical protein